MKLSVPLNYIISYTNQYIRDPIIDTLDKVINFEWQANYTHILKPEILSPPLFTLLPSVVIIPQDCNFEIRGSFKDWNSYGNWEFGLLQGLDDLPETEKSKIRTLIKDAKEDKDKIKILYHYLQDETRYINITIETGGLKPYPAAYVANNKYGDCKALTNYFKSVLAYIGIESYYTNVYAGGTIKKINKDFPSQQFNHVILYIPMKENDIWLDCTSDGAFNYLGTFSQNRDAFIIDEDNSHFLKTPALNPSDVLDSRNIEIKYTPQKAVLRYKNIYQSGMYENLLNFIKNFNESEKTMLFRNHFIDDGFDLTNYMFSIQDRDSVRIDLIYEASSQNIYKHYGNDILINNVPFSLPHFEKLEDRKLPVQIDYPIYNIDTLIYDIPIGYVVTNHIYNNSISNKYGQYRYDVSEYQGKLRVIKSLLINPGYYLISEYEDFFNFYKQINEEENKTLLSLHEKM